MQQAMNGYASKAFTFATAIALAFALMLTLGAGQAHAYSYLKHMAKANGTIAVSYDSGCEITLWSNSNAKPKAVKVSNKSLAKVNVEGGCISIYPKKTGTATLTYYWKHKTHTVKIEVHKYQNPIASLTIGGKQYKAKFAKKRWCDLGCLTGKKTAPRGTLKVKGAKNWQVKNIMVYNGDIKSGSKITKAMDFVNVTMYNKKTKVVEEVCLDWGPGTWVG